MKRLLIASVLAFATLRAHAITFVEDDYTKATAQAKAKNVPIFVEAWAPW